MADHAIGLLDTSVLIDQPDNLGRYADVLAISAVSVGELALGLHHRDPIESAIREARYRDILTAFDPVPYDADVAHWYGAIAAAVKSIGRSPRPRAADLMIAATARHLTAALITRNPDDFRCVERFVNVVALPAAAR